MTAIRNYCCLYQLEVTKEQSQWKTIMIAALVLKWLFIWSQYIHVFWFKKTQLNWQHLLHTCYQNFDDDCCSEMCQHIHRISGYGAPRVWNIGINVLLWPSLYKQLFTCFGNIIWGKVQKVIELCHFSREEQWCQQNLPNILICDIFRWSTRMTTFTRNLHNYNKYWKKFKTVVSSKYKYKWMFQLGLRPKIKPVGPITKVRHT